MPLLTGDGRLRKLAEKEHKDIELRGTLWLVEEIVRQKVITVSQAHVAYQKMKDAGSWLPWKDAERRLKALE